MVLSVDVVYKDFSECLIFVIWDLWFTLKDCRREDRLYLGVVFLGLVFYRFLGVKLCGGGSGGLGRGKGFGRFGRVGSSRCGWRRYVVGFGCRLFRVGVFGRICRVGRSLVVGGIE